MNLVEEISKAITTMSDVGTPEQRQALLREAAGYNLSQWKQLAIGKACAAGVAAGMWGGPIVAVTEVADIAYLLRIIGRGGFGVGHILGSPVDYDTDILGFLMVWSGHAEAVSDIVEGKVMLPLWSAASSFAPYFTGSAEAGGVSASAGVATASAKTTAKAASKGTAKVAAKSSSKAAGLAGKAASKVIMKSSLKVGSKVGQKLTPLAAGAVASKLGAKATGIWVPIIGGVLSGGVNWWVMHDVLQAAERYYQAQYLAFDPSLLPSDVQ